MKTLAVLSTKGGSGKSTLAVHLAVTAQDRDGLTVGLADCDPQGSAALWYRLREHETPGLAQVTPAELADFQRRAAETTDLLIVDVAPAHSADVATVAALADFCIIPTRPSVFDIDGIRTAVAEIARAGTPGAVVLNCCPPPRGVGESGVTVEARQALQGEPLPVAPVSVAQRATFSYALLNGAAAHEFEPDGKAAAEMRSLWEWVKEEMA